MSEPGFGRPMMLWMLTGEKMSLVEKVLKGIAHYQAKHGKMPNIALINKAYANEIGIPDGSGLSFATIAGVPVHVTDTLQSNHILIGHVEGLTLQTEEEKDVNTSS